VEYGSEFDKVFLYCQTSDSTQVVMSKESSIAQRYRQLCGELQQEEEGEEKHLTAGAIDGLKKSSLFSVGTLRRPVHAERGKRATRGLNRCVNHT